MKTLPEIRDELHAIANDSRIPRELASKIHELAEATRKRGGNRGASTSVPMTEELREKIELYHAAHPGVPQFEIAKKFGVNQGRVSETLRGFRA